MIRVAGIARLVIIIAALAGASYVGTAAPRAAQQPDVIGIPVSSPSVIPGASPHGPSATGTPAAALLGAPDSARASDGRQPSAMTPTAGPRLTAGTTPKASPAAPTTRPTIGPRVPASPRRTPRPAPTALTSRQTAPHASQRPQVASDATARPRAAPGGSGSLSGLASWFCLPGRSACTRGYPASGMYAAAGPAIRAALGDWRGRTVIVRAGNAAVTVRLIDWCSCPDGRVLDLYAAVWQGLGVPLSAGLVDVGVRW